MATDEQVEPEPQPYQRRPGEMVGILVTNLIKLGGLVIAIDEVLGHDVIRPGALGIAALMMAGAQSLETFLTSFFGGPGKKSG